MRRASRNDGGALPQIEDVFLREPSSLADQSLRDGRVRERFGVTVVAVTRASGEFALHPSPEKLLRSGDTVRVFGLPAQIEAFRREAGGEAQEETGRAGPTHAKG